MTFDEALKLFQADGLRFDLDLQRHEDREEEFVDLVETADGVGEGQKGQIVDDVLDSLDGERRSVGMRDGDIEELEKLAQRRLIHRTDAAHCDDQEIQNRTACCH